MVEIPFFVCEIIYGYKKEIKREKAGKAFEVEVIFGILKYIYSHCISIISLLIMHNKGL
jgi:hypothetical protein